MPTKRELIDDPLSAWNRAGDDEEIFILRGHDALAPLTLRRWAKHVLKNGGPRSMVNAARRAAYRMELDEARTLPWVLDADEGVPMEQDSDHL